MYLFQITCNLCYNIHQYYYYYLYICYTYNREYTVEILVNNNLYSIICYIICVIEIH